MTKIETDFEKLNHYQDIETYYPPLDDIKDFLYELFGDRVESQKYIVRTNQKLEQLQSNWNSLRECIIGVIEGAREELNTIIHTTDSFTYANQCSREFDVIRKNLVIVLDKMNELEESDNR